MRRRHFARAAEIVIAGNLAVFSLAGCANYTQYSSLPLPEKTSLAERLPVQTTRPLDMNAVATVAVLYNPDLKAARLKSGVAEAQAFAAGILPNPVLTANLDPPIGGGSEVFGYGLGIEYDIQALIVQPARVAAANAARDEARLSLLWQEWQTVAQARTLYVQRVNATEKSEIYTALQERYATQADRSTRALQTGDVTFDQAGIDLAALLDVRSQLSTTERTAAQTDYALRTLLGVAPQVEVPLQPLMRPPIPDRAEIEAALARIAQSRPDLRALQFGYQSQQETLRRSVLAQFPSLSLGVGAANDTTNVHTISLGATLNLPLFDRNQGDIAVQSATRAQLLAEYQARLDQSTGDAWRIWTEMQQLNSAIGDIEARLPELQVAADNAERAYLAGDLPALTYVTLQSSVLNRQTELSDLRQSLWNDAIALSSVIGTQVVPAVEPALEMKEPMP
jgi:cobalt-zinc-cadmium efflux system outer membrane protein